MPIAAPTPPTGYNYLALSASGLVKTGEGICGMVKISTSTDLILKFWDGVAASGTVIQSNIAVDAKEEHDIPAQFRTGLYVEIISGSGTFTVYFI